MRTTRSLCTLFVLGLVLAPALAMAERPARAQAPRLAADDTAIRALIAEQAAAWNRNDAATWSRSFAPDADFVNIFGMVFHGRQQIEDRHAAIFATIFKGSHTTVTVRRIVFPSARMAIVDTDHVVTRHAPLPPALQLVDGALRTRMKYVMRKGAGGWQIIAAQNTDIKPAPARPAAKAPGSRP